jgi:hypothetical protein
MNRFFLLASALSLALVLASTRAMWGQEKDTVGSLAAKGFEVRGIFPEEALMYVIMQKGSEVYVCGPAYVLLGKPVQAISACVLQK